MIKISGHFFDCDNSLPNPCKTKTKNDKKLGIKIENY